VSSRPRSALSPSSRESWGPAQPHTATCKTWLTDHRNHLSTLSYKIILSYIDRLFVPIFPVFSIFFPFFRIHITNSADRFRLLRRVLYCLFDIGKICFQHLTGKANTRRAMAELGLAGLATAELALKSVEQDFLHDPV
jgi:hypothetical protein